MSRWNLPPTAYAAGEGRLTVLTLLQAGQVTSSQITAAVNAVLAGLATDTYALAEGWTLDLVAMTGASALVAMALKSDQTQWKRGMVRRAILSSHPVNA